MSTKVRYTPASPGPVAASFARYVAENYGDAYPEIVSSLTPEIAQAFFSFHNEWQKWRGVSGERKAEADARAEIVSAKATARIEKAKKVLADAGVLPIPTPASRKSASRKSA